MEPATCTTRTLARPCDHGTGGSTIAGAAAVTAGAIAAGSGRAGLTPEGAFASVVAGGDAPAEGIAPALAAGLGEGPATGRAEWEGWSDGGLTGDHMVLAALGTVFSRRHRTFREPFGGRPA